MNLKKTKNLKRLWYKGKVFTPLKNLHLRRYYRYQKPLLYRKSICRIHQCQPSQVHVQQNHFFFQSDLNLSVPSIRQRGRQHKNNLLPLPFWEFLDVPWFCAVSCFMFTEYFLCCLLCFLLSLLSDYIFLGSFFSFSFPLLFLLWSLIGITVRELVHSYGISTFFRDILRVFFFCSGTLQKN